VDIIRHGENGLLARPNDPADLATQLATLLTDPALARRMGRRARELARGQSWEEINRRLLDDYRAVVAEARAAAA
jgi:glycosyltransferase involved in cell wall biosynthesis